MPTTNVIIANYSRSNAKHKNYEKELKTKLIIARNMLLITIVTKQEQHRSERNILGHSFVHVQVNASIKQHPVTSKRWSSHRRHELVTAAVNCRCKADQHLKKKTTYSIF